MDKIIGQVTSYNGSEFKWMKGLKVRVVSVLRDLDGSEEEEYDVLDNDDDIISSGGIKVGDRVEVQPFLEREGRFSFVTSDPLACDLALFDGVK